MPIKLKPKTPPYYEIVPNGEFPTTQCKNGLQTVDGFIELGGILTELETVITDPDERLGISLYYDTETPFYEIFMSTEDGVTKNSYITAYTDPDYNYSETRAYAPPYTADNIQEAVEWARNEQTTVLAGIAAKQTKILQMIDEVTHELSLYKSKEGGDDTIKLKMPDEYTGINDRYMVVSVNGVYADASGNVDLT